MGCRAATTLFIAMTPLSACDFKDKSGDDAWGDDELGDRNDDGWGGGSYRTHLYFPLDGERYWNYQNPSEDYLLDVTIDSTEYKGNQAVRTLRYQNGSLDTVMYWVKWSSDASSGVQIHGYLIEEYGAEWVNFNTPITIAPPGETLETTTNGATYTSTFAGVESCANNWADTAWDCAKIIIETDQTNPPPFVGTWHWAPEFGTSLFQPQGANSPWILTDFDWSPMD